MLRHTEPPGGGHSLGPKKHLAVQNKIWGWGLPSGCCLGSAVPLAAPVWPDAGAAARPPLQGCLSGRRRRRSCIH